MLELFALHVAFFFNIFFKRVGKLNDFPELQSDLANVQIVVEDPSGFVALHHCSECPV
jgi:hypothetical protein